MRGPPPPPSGRAGPVPKKKIQTFEQSEDFVALNPLPPSKKIIPIEDFDWESIIRIHGSSDGSSGVLFVYNKDGTGVVKGVDDKTDFPANLMVLHYGIPVPKTIPITFHEGWIKIKTIRYSTMDQSTRRRLDALLGKAQVHLLELIDGISLRELAEHPDFHPLLLKDDIEENKQVLFRIGEITALDLVLNNWDRVPFFWKNEGNAGNIMLKKDGTVIAIDQKVCSIPYDEQKKKHFDSMSLFLDQYLSIEPSDDSPFTFEIGDEVAAVSSPLHRVRAFFLNASTIDITPKGVQVFLAGFRFGCKSLSVYTTSQVTSFFTQASTATGESNPSSDDSFFLMKGISLFKSKLK